MLKIKPDELNNEFFSIIKSNTPNLCIYCMDYLSNQLLEKTYYINEVISFPYISEETAILPTYYIKKLITNSAIEKISELASINRRNNIEYVSRRLDISVEALKKTYPDNNISRMILSKIISASTFIATNGRIGPAQYMISNFTTYEHLIRYISQKMELVFDRNVLNLGGTHYYFDEQIEDGHVIFGRKDVENSGVSCLILTDDDGYIKMYKGYSDLYFYYKIIVCGENQYLKINTRDITYYRKKKLEKLMKLRYEKEEINS
jgi:hypothetical protein